MKRGAGEQDLGKQRGPFDRWLCTVKLVCLRLGVAMFERYAEQGVGNACTVLYRAACCLDLVWSSGFGDGGWKPDCGSVTSRESRVA